ncbi:MAG: hypothetical protein HZB59_08440 [Ignavibacteriales bacterium]|nr:hypothetical protein [Ignavibacteriales bacterium]
MDKFCCRAALLRFQHQKRSGIIFRWNDRRDYFALALKMFQKAMRLALTPSDQLYAILGIKDSAVAILQQNIKKGRYSQYLFLLNNPFFDNLRSDVRFQDIINKQRVIYEEGLKTFSGL